MATLRGKGTNYILYICIYVSYVFHERFADPSRSTFPKNMPVYAWHVPKYLRGPSSPIFHWLCKTPDIGSRYYITGLQITCQKPDQLPPCLYPAILEPEPPPCRGFNPPWTPSSPDRFRFVALQLSLGQAKDLAAPRGPWRPRSWNSGRAWNGGPVVVLVRCLPGVGERDWGTGLMPDTKLGLGMAHRAGIHGITGCLVRCFHPTKATSLYKLYIHLHHP